MISISKPKLLALAIILLVGSASFYLGHVLASPSPTISHVVTPGSIGPCTWFISLDGTTPVAQAMVGGLSVSPGDNLVGSAGQDMGAFMNAITTVNTKYCFSNQIFTYTTQWTVISGISVTGSYNSTVFKAGTNSMSIMAFTNAGLSTNPRTTNVDVEYLTLDSTGKTGIIGVNFNESINENSNHIHLNELHFLGNGWSYIIIGDGNEDSTVDNIFSDIFSTPAQGGCGDVSWKTYTGTAYIYHIVFGEINGCTSGSYVHLMGSTIFKDSVIGGILLECQVGSQTGSGGTTNCIGAEQNDDGDWFCNGAGTPAIYAKNGQNPIISTMIIRDAIICVPANTGVIETNSTNTKIGINTLEILHSKITLANSATSALLYSSATGSNIILNAGLTLDNCFISGTGGVWAYTNGAVGTIQVSQFHFRQNYINGAAPTKGSYVSQGNGNYFMGTEPAGFGQSTPGFTGSPSLPAGTGSGNQQADPFGWPELITWSNATNVGAHIVDSLGSDNVLLGAQYSAFLYPGEHIYFNTNLPSAWKWEGMVW